MNQTQVPTYSFAERDRRWALAQAFMDREGLDALIVFGEHAGSSPAPFNFDTWLTNGQPGSTIVFPRGGEPIALVALSMVVMNDIESARRGDPIWIAPQRLRVGRNSGRLAEVLNEQQLTKGTIGIIGLEPYGPFFPEGIVPYESWAAIRKEFPDVEFTPVGRSFARLTMSLSDEEVAVVRHSASIGDAMAKAMVETAGPGISESAVYAAGMAAAFERGTTVPAMGMWTGPDPIGWGGPQWSYRPQAPRTLQEGDVIRSEVFCNFGMRDTQHQVMIAVGEVHEDYARAEKVARATYDAGLEALRPGKTFGDVVEKMLVQTVDKGGWVPGPQFHGMNPFGSLCGYPGNSGQFDPSGTYPTVPDRPTFMGDLVLEPGMTFAFEPNYGYGRRVVTIGGTVIVGDDAAIELNPFTAQMHRTTE